jgi:hypothetical protein
MLSNREAMSNRRERIDLDAGVIVLGILFAVCLLATIVRFAGFI